MNVTNINRKIYLSQFYDENRRTIIRVYEKNHFDVYTNS